MSTKKRIAIYHNLPTGGGIRMLNEIINRLKSNGYVIDSYTIGESNMTQDLSDNHFFYKVKIPSGFFLKHLYLFFVLPRIHKKIAQHINGRYKVCVLTHDYLTKSPYLIRYLKTKKIYICHEAQREFYENTSIHTTTTREVIANYLRYPIKVIDEYNVRKSDVVISNSKYSKKNIDKIYNINSKIVYPGVDASFFKPDNKVKKKKNIVAIGGLNPTKDPLFLINSLSPILKEYELTLIGSGKEDYLKKIAGASRGLKVKILSNISDIELKKKYNESLITCVVSHKEPFGLTSLESQACGTPVVAINDGGVSETIIHGKTGYLCKRSKKVFLKLVKKSISNRSKLSRTSRENVLGRWQWRETLRPLDKIISDAFKD